MCNLQVAVELSNLHSISIAVVLILAGAAIPHVIITLEPELSLIIVTPSLTRWTEHLLRTPDFKVDTTKSR